MMKWTVVIGLANVVRAALAAELPLVPPEVYQYAPLRVFGTNLYDFSETIQSVLKGQPDPRYCVRGQITQVNVAEIPGSMIIRRACGTPGYLLRSGSNDLANADDQLVALAAVSLARTTNGTIPANQYAALPPTVQTNFEWFQPTEEVLIANLPKEFLRLGRNVQLFALPLGRYQPKSGAFGAEGILYFDYGQRFVGDLGPFTTLYRVTPSGIISTKLPGSSTATNVATNEATQKLIRWQQQEATNGAAHAQYSLAKRYLSGDGVPIDPALAEYWLRKAAEQNYPDAVRLLESHAMRSGRK